MNIPIDAEVRCGQEACGRSRRVVINPTTQQVTHIVVRDKDSVLRLVPIERILESDPDMVRLSCTPDEMAQFPRFLETEYITSESPMATYAPGAFVLWPYMTPRAGVVPIEHRRVPPGELTVRRGASVEANDGHVGRVDAFLIDPLDGRISHMILRENHLWGKKDISIPVERIDRIQEDKVYLTLSKKDVEALPEIPVGPANL